jgi:hypothetical protein
MKNVDIQSEVATDSARRPCAVMVPRSEILATDSAWRPSAVMVPRSKILGAPLLNCCIAPNTRVVGTAIQRAKTDCLQGFAFPVPMDFHGTGILSHEISWD